MAKAPKPGVVKTRLTPGLPSPAVIALYRSLLQDTVALATSLAGVEVAVMCRDSDKEPLAELLGKTVRIVAQKGEGLAAGLTSVFREFTTGAAREVIAFNSDTPHLAPSVLETAFEILAMHDVVVGPTQDGGYYLVGAKAVHPTLFENDGLGTSSAFGNLLARASSLGLSTGLTETFYDIDLAEDLFRLAPELRRMPARAPRTAAWFEQWEQAVSRLREGLGER
jgi:rSAM/selenodomain-associated transferase 1